MVWRDSIWDEMNDLHRKIDSLFSGFFSEFRGDEFSFAKEKNYRKALTDFQETEKEFIIQVELPGIDKKDIDLNITENRIEIRAKWKSETKIQKQNIISYTQGYAGFYQSFEVPEEADLNKVDASYKNGILTIKIPKKLKKKDKKFIQIK